VGEGSRLTRIDRSFSPKNWSEGEELLLTIQAIVAREFPTAECVNVLLEPCCQAAKVELLTLQGKSQPLWAKSARHSSKLPKNTAMYRSLDGELHSTPDISSTIW
jgi:hypothetical protein